MRPLGAFVLVFLEAQIKSTCISHNSLFIFHETMYNKTIIEFGSSDIRNNQDYVGYTARHLFQRVAEHKNSTIGKHFHEAHGRRNRLNESHFKILRKCQGKFECLVFEMLYIKKFKPNLNVQTDSIRAKLLV